MMRYIFAALFCFMVYFNDGSIVKFPSATHLYTKGSGSLGGSDSVFKLVHYDQYDSLGFQELALIPMAEVKFIQQFCSEEVPQDANKK